MSHDPARANSGSAALVVRVGRDGALYFKITSGVHEAFDLNVNEPVAFCPFCGSKLGVEATGADTLLIEHHAEEELTVVAGKTAFLVARA
jgi:hypothetical protein